jgi:hypothetical protein
VKSKLAKKAQKTGSKKTVIKASKKVSRKKK